MLIIGVTAYELPTRRGGREAAVNKQIVFKSLSLLSSDSSHGQSKKPLLSSTLYSALAAVSFLLYTTSGSLRFVFPNTISSLLVNTYGILLTNTSVLQPRNLDLQHVCCWLQANKLSLNAVKCKYMIIGSQYNLSHMNYIPDINILGHKIERVFYVDQLGVTIDDQLKWDKHVDKLCKKLSSALFSMKQVKFLPIASRLTLYRSLVETRLRYCNVVWGNCGTTLINKLQHLQNRAIDHHSFRL